MFSKITERLRLRSEYRRTVFALKGLPRTLAEDLDIYPGDEERLARRAVYGL